MNADWKAVGRLALAMAATGMLGAAAPAQSTAKPGRAAEAERKAGEIMIQPAQDVGIAKLKIPAILVKARENPYGLEGLKTCAQLTDAVNELNATLGPDFAIGLDWKENRAGKLAEAGGRAVVNSLLPYRGIVREVSGAGPAQRRLTDAINAGYARRGFLRGIHSNRRCKSAFAADLVRENGALR